MLTGPTVPRTVVEHNSSQLANCQIDGAAHRLHELLMDLVRAAGLVEPDQPVPGQPVSMSQAFALHELDTDPPLSQRDLAERLRLEKSTVSRMAAEMERTGLLIRERDPDNRRTYRLRLTGQGRALHTKLASAFHGQFVQWVATLTAAERDGLLVGLPALIHAIRGATLAPAGAPSHTPHATGPR